MGEENSEGEDQVPPGSLNVEGKTSGRGSILVKGQKVEFDVPPGWEILCQSLPRRETVSERSTEQLAKGSLENPIGSKRIQDLANPTSSVAIMVDDDTRPTPVREVLPVVLKVLEDAKVPRENIDIIIAVGTHPPMPGEKLERRLGTHILKNYRVTNHDSWAPDLVRVGQVGDIEIRINPIVARADLRIGIGSNLPHPFAGFGGGPKIAMPGICGYDTIREHHTSTLMEQGSYLGRVAGNPFYEFIRRASEMLGLDYVIDCVLDSDGRAVAIFSGHPLEAHEAGIRTCREIYGLEIDEQADVTIASAHPHEEGPQIMKPILPAVMATRRGGTLILVASCEGGLAEPFLEMFDLVQSRNPGNPMKTVLEHMRARKAFVPKSPMDFNCAIQVTIACLREINVILVSENVTEAEASRIGFRHARELETAIQMARDTYGRAKVSVFAAGGIVLPLVQKEVDLFGSETV